jgi:ankyrin repeat protein
LAELLLDHGADPDRDTAFRDTPLACASDLGDRAMIELLLDRGARVELPRPRHPGALERAAWSNRPELVELLLARGADPDRVLARGDGSVILVQPPILALLIAAGGHASSSIVSMVEAELALRARRAARPTP